MGGGSSKSKIARPSSFASRLTNSTEKQLIVGTKDVRDMADTLFNFMYKTWDNKELWDMADRPQEYVIALSDLIEQHFISVGYTTQRNKHGEIYFLRYDKLKPPADSAKHKENSQVIAFYFIRIFQILGAMLLVIKDVSFPITDDQGNRNLGKPDGRIVRPSLDMGRFIKLPFQRGGSRVDPNLPLGPYEFLRYYLRDLTETMISDYNNKFQIDLRSSAKSRLYEITPNLFFKYEPINADKQIISQPRSYPQQFLLFGTELIGSQKVKSLFSLKVTIENFNPSPIPYVTPSSLSSSRDPRECYPMFIEVNLGGSSRNKNNVIFNRNQEKISNANITDYANGIEYTISQGDKLKYINTGDTRVDNTSTGSSRRRFGKKLELLALLALRDNNPTKHELKLFPVVEEEKESKPTAIGEMPNKLRNPAMDEIYQILKGRKNQPHCLARAIQLLQPEAINKSFPESGKDGVKTSICKFSLGNKTDTVPLDKYVPIKAMAQLFGRVDKAKFEQGRKVIEAFVGSQATKTPISVDTLKSSGQEDEAKELQEALDRLTAAFKIVDQDGKSKKVGSFSEITVSKPGECSKNPDENLKTPTLERVHATANALIQYHINNTINITIFLEKIFNIDKEPGSSERWYVPLKKDPSDPNPRKDERLIVKGINENILLGGFPILDQITANARDLLVEYYEKCETLYQTGLASWKQGIPETPVANPSGVANLTKGQQPGAPLPGALPQDRLRNQSNNNPVPPSEVPNVRSKDPSRPTQSK